MKNILVYVIEAAKILGSIAAYILFTYLLGLIHPLLPGFVILVAVVGFLTYMFGKMKIDDAEHKAKMAEIKARSDESLAQLEATCNRIRERALNPEPLVFDVECDHTQCSDSEDDDAPITLTRYDENDPVQRA